MNYKKSQMEVFGLAMIVVLITIGFFIFVSLRNQNPPQDIKKDYITDETATNFINSIINVDVKECYENGYTIARLIKFCRTNEAVSCDGAHGTDACYLANATIYDILNKTLIKQNYHFWLHTENLGWTNNAGGEINISNGHCGEAESKGMQGTFPVSLYPIPGHVYLNLDLCTGG
jgi:hypothetical protein